MLSFMDYVLRSFGEQTGWNRDNSYSSLTATADALLDFQTPHNARLHLSSLSSTQFASSYSLGTLGLVDGNISYLFSTSPLFIPAASSSLPLRSLVLGYRQLNIPIPPYRTTNPSLPEDEQTEESILHAKNVENKKPTLLHATLQLPPPSTLNGLYSRRTSPNTLVTISLFSNTATSTFSSSPPPAALLGHVAHDTGKWSLEGLASTDSALLGARGLWNFGVNELCHPKSENVTSKSELEIPDEGLSDLPPAQPSSAAPRDPPIPPSLLSAGAEVYYSPLSSVVGLSTGLRFTTLSSSSQNISSLLSAAPRFSSKPLSGTSALLSSQASSLQTSSAAASTSFPYTITLTLTPLTGSLASTYSVLATKNLSFSSRFGFNVYSWESECVIGAEIWRSRSRSRRQGKKQATEESEADKDKDKDNLAWAREKAAVWLEEAKKTARSNVSPVSGSPESAEDPNADGEPGSDGSVIKLRIDDGWNVRALWVGRYKELLISAGLNLGPTGMGNRGSGVETWQTQTPSAVAGDGNGGIGGGGGGGPSSWGRWKGAVGVEVAWSSQGGG